MFQFLPESFKFFSNLPLYRFYNQKLIYITANHKVQLPSKLYILTTFIGKVFQFTCTTKTRVTNKVCDSSLSSIHCSINDFGRTSDKTLSQRITPKCTWVNSICRRQRVFIKMCCSYFCHQSYFVFMVTKKNEKENVLDNLWRRWKRMTFGIINDLFNVSSN